MLLAVLTLINLGARGLAPFAKAVVVMLRNHHISVQHNSTLYVHTPLSLMPQVPTLCLLTSHS